MKISDLNDKIKLHLNSAKLGTFTLRGVVTELNFVEYANKRYATLILEEKDTPKNQPRLISIYLTRNLLEGLDSAGFILENNQTVEVTGTLSLFNTNLQLNCLTLTLLTEAQQSCAKQSSQTHINSSSSSTDELFNTSYSLLKKIALILIVSYGMYKILF